MKFRGCASIGSDDTIIILISNDRDPAMIDSELIAFTEPKHPHLIQHNSRGNVA